MPARNPQPVRIFPPLLALGILGGCQLLSPKISPTATTGSDLSATGGDAISHNVINDLWPFIVGQTGALAIILGMVAAVIIVYIRRYRYSVEKPRYEAKKNGGCS